MSKTFLAYWLRLVVANKSLENDQAKMTLTVLSLRNQIEKAYNQGVQDQKCSEQEVPEHKKQGPFGGLFDGLFGFS